MPKLWLNFCCHQRKLQRMSHFDILITKTVGVNMVNEQVTSISHQLLELSPLVSTSICHFFCLSVWSSAHRAPYLRNCTPCDHNFWYTYVKWWYHPVFCSFRFCFFRLLGRGVGGKTAKEGPKWKKKNYICHTSYLRNSITYGHDFWYTCVKWRYGQTRKTACLRLSARVRVFFRRCGR